MNESNTMILDKPAKSQKPLNFEQLWGVPEQEFRGNKRSSAAPVEDREIIDGKVGVMEDGRQELRETERAAAEQIR